MSIIEDHPGKQVLLMGNEAIARGVVEAGVSVTSSYPGTPASEIMETLLPAAKHFGFHAEWAVNEMTAFNVVAGAAMVGKRGFSSMKNAGFNWIMDMLMTVVYGGIRGGLVIAVADDPSARTSSNEQDSRFGAMWDQILCLEPSNQQEAKDMTRDAFDLSEEIELPVMVRSVARISHSLGDVSLGEIRKDEEKPVFDKHWKLPFRWNVYGPPSTHSKHVWLCERFPTLLEQAEKSRYNTLKLSEGSEYGIIAPGISYAYSQEALRWLDATNNVSVLKLGTTHPIPERKVEQLLNHARKIVVLDEGDPVVELQVRNLAQKLGIDTKIYGKKYNPILPMCGELDTDIVVDTLVKLLGKKAQKISDERMNTKTRVEQLIAPRSSAWCAGCPHIGTYFALRRALMKIGGKIPIVNGDIGCYEMAGYGVFAKKIEPSFSEESVRYTLNSPYELLDTLHVMGSGIGVSQGMYHTGYSDGRIVAVTGDSTFFHACIPQLINAVWNDVKITFVIFDNSWTAMTGHQPHPGTGIMGSGESSKSLSIEDICKACGVEDVYVGDPVEIDRLIDTFETALKSEKLSVVISRRICAQVLSRQQRREGITVKPYSVDDDACVGCRICLQLGCPAILFDPESRKAGIDGVQCVGCGICSPVCPIDAITQEGSQ